MKLINIFSMKLQDSDVENKFFPSCQTAKLGVLLSDQVTSKWEKLQPIMLLVERGLHQLDDIEFDIQEAKQAINHIQNNVLANAYFNFMRQLDTYNTVPLIDTKFKYDGIILLFKEVTTERFEFVNLELNRLKTNIQHAIFLLK